MIVVSHRGPESFSARPGGGFTHRRGAGGVVSALRPLLAGTDSTWVAAPVDDDDRAAIAAGAAHSDEFDLHLVPIDPETHRLHYQVVSNAVLWFLHHGLFDLTRQPVFDRDFRQAWEAYRTVNAAFADEVAAAAHEGQTVLVHDYHFALVPGMLEARRPDLPVVYFQHTPFCGPNSMRVLPTDIAAEMLASLCSAPAGFHVPRWARAYQASVREVLGDAVLAPAFAASLGPDPEALHEAAAEPAAETERAALDEWAGDRKLVLRVDRIEPSKNIVRGFRAFDLLLDERPDWRGRVVFLALVYPSREGLAEYLAYRQEVESAAERVNTKWATSDWQPVRLDTSDAYHRSLAGYRRYDVLLVNPLRDGLNLVAKEGPILNERHGVLALSREAGAFDELAEAALEVHPFDVEQTAGALARALDMDPSERVERANRLAHLAAARTAKHWLDDLVTHAG